MLTVCAWCEKVLLPDGRTMSWPISAALMAGSKEPLSHGVCLKCKENLLAEVNELKAGEVRARLRQVAP